MLRRRTQGGRHRRIRREVTWTVGAVVAILVFEIFVLPRLGGVNQSLHLLSHINIGVALTGLVLEAAALVAWAMLTYTVLPPGILARRRIMQIDLSTLAVSHVMPGGTAFGAALMYRLFTQEGVQPSDAGFAIAMQGVGSAVVLNVIFWIALVISMFFHAYNPLYALAAGLGILLMAAFAGVVLLLTKGRIKVLEFARRTADRLPFVDGDTLADGVQHFADRLRLFARDRSLMRQAVGWATANWLFDAACLWVFLAAFHTYISPVDLLVAYGLANIIAVIPITPSGLGVIELVLITTLHGFGVPEHVAVLGVIGYRLVNFWLPIPIGGFAYLSLRFSELGWRSRLHEVHNEVFVEKGKEARAAKDE
jgi:uncharacterized protein (TIRG00374 family)